ncbi:hypothetical protein [Providencia rettgeri]|uniref:hypothetical protein n=1 Tax=Providencia rettgeri TaxID=587 RepID=UPI00029BD388|nr:hypothetical protein [Providencia rettgeri]EKT59053.1 hypothetical protein OOC_05227 [Providencia rettgeri Dmel1]
MDIENNKMEKISARVKLDLCNYFDWNNIGVNYNVIDVDEKKIYVLSSDYEWQLIYWHHDMDLSLKERLFAGVQYWSNYSDAYQKILTKLDKGNKKLIFVIGTIIYLRYFHSMETIKSHMSTYFHYINGVQ